MDRALKIGRLIAYAAEVTMAAFVAIDTFKNLSEKKKDSGTSNHKDKAAEEAVPTSNQ